MVCEKIGYKDHYYIRYTGWNGLVPARFQSFILYTEQEYMNMPEKKVYPCRGDLITKEMVHPISQGDLYIIKLQSV